MYQGVYNGTKKHEPDLENVLKRSWEAGLKRIIITGGNLQESKRALEISKRNDNLFSTVGCHPTRCLEFEENEASPHDYLKNLEKLALENKSKVVAIGECGLDYDRTQFCPKEIQIKYFEMQLKLTETLKLPLFLHCRNAATDLYNILSKHDNLKGVVHSFDGTLEEAMKFIDLGYFIGLNGCSLKTKENLETVAQLPADCLLVETDCPWCEIRPSHAGYKYISKENHFQSVKKEKWSADFMVKNRNEPANIRQVFEVLAAIRNEDPNSLSEIIYNNTLKLFF
ncbi:putative deoxyribonuclease TATDN1 isoform X2 [Agrilus planipennis]|nr:putative deoxyribonuclease TATDN1 isoform X2 [Agrilus planipennis]